MFSPFLNIWHKRNSRAVLLRGETDRQSAGLTPPLLIQDMNWECAAHITLSLKPFGLSTNILPKTWKSR